jgi:hypothetical protein
MTSVVMTKVSLCLASAPRDPRRRFASLGRGVVDAQPTFSQIAVRSEPPRPQSGKLGAALSFKLCERLPSSLHFLRRAARPASAPGRGPAKNASAITSSKDTLSRVTFTLTHDRFDVDHYGEQGGLAVFSCIDGTHRAGTGTGTVFP